MKHLYLISFLIAFVPSVAANADSGKSPQTPIPLTDEERTWLRDHPDISFGFTEDFEPLLIEDANGEHFGVLIDFLNELNTRLATRFAVKVSPIPNVRDKINKNELAGSLAHTSVGADSWGLLKTKEIMTVYPAIFALADAPFEIKALGGLSGKSVAVLDIPIFSEMILESAGREISPHKVQSFRHAMQMVFRGEADAAIGFTFHNYSITKYGMTGIKPVHIFWDKPVDCVMGVRSDWPELVSILNKGIASIPKKEMNAIQAKWFNIPTEKTGTLRLTEKERLWLADHKHIRLGVAPAWPPFEYFDADGAFQGLSSTYVQKINEAFGIVMTPIKSKTFSESFDKALAGKVDVLPTVMKSPSRTGRLNFSKPHTIFPLVILTRNDAPYVKDIGDLKDWRIGTINGFVTEEILRKDYPKFKSIGFDSIENALLALSRGKIDAFLGDTASISYVTKKLGLDNLKVAAPTNHRFELAFGVRKDWPELISILNKFVDSIPPREKRMIEHGWTNIRVEKQVDWSIVWRWAFVICGFFGFILMLTIIWNWGLKNEVNKRKNAEDELRRSKEQLTLAAEAAEIGMWDWNIQTGEVRYSRLWAEILGYSKNEIASHVDAWKDLVHPDDMPRAMRKLDENLEGKTPFYECEHRLRTKSEGWRWALARGKVSEWKEDGTAARHSGVYFDITERKASEEEKERLFRDLGERLKELNCLYGVSHLIQESDIPLENILQGVVDLIPHSWQYPDIASARITLRGKEFATANFRETAWKQSSIITVKDDRVGELEVCYLEKMPEKDEGPFLKEERRLLDSVAKQVGRTIEYNKAREALRESEERYRMLVENTDDIVYSINSGGAINYMSPQISRYGYTFDDVVSKQYLEFVSSEQKHEVKNCFQEGTKHKTSRPTEFQFIDKNDHPHWVETVGRIICDDSGHPLSQVGVMRDISERKKAEKELKKAWQAAESANHAKTLFLAKMNHELRTPLNAIFGFAQLICHDSETPRKHRENVRIMIKSCEHLMTIINDILELAKAEKGGVRLKESVCDLAEVLDTVEAIIRKQFEDKSIRLTFEISPNLPDKIKTDQGKLRQILINLLGNAIKFTEKGSITVRVGCMGSTRCFGDSEPVRLYFEIEDTGTGIPPDELDFIFEAFHQSNDLKIKSQGIGLGLTISREFVRMMGGDISVSSHAGVGTAFRFNILATAARDAILPDRKTGNFRLAPKQPPPRILVVDDEFLNGKALALALKTAGFVVDQAMSGEEAIEKYQACPPDLIWMDLQLPGLNGFEITKRIREIESHDNENSGHSTNLSIPIIALTADSFDFTKNAALAAGCDDFLSKPFGYEDIFQMTGQYLDVRYVGEEHARQEDKKMDGGEILDGMAALPSELISKIEKDITEGNHKRALTHIVEIRGLNSDIADMLDEMVHRFEYRKLLSLIQKARLGKNE